MGIGEKINTIRKQLKITQQSLAEKVGASQTHISSIIRDVENPSIDLLQRIAQALQCSLYIDLIPEGEQPPQQPEARSQTLQQAPPTPLSVMELTASLNERLKHEYESLSHHEKVAIEGLLASCMATIQQENHVDEKAG